MFFERRALRCREFRKFRMREGVFQHWAGRLFPLHMRVKGLTLK